MRSAWGTKLKLNMFQEVTLVTVTGVQKPDRTVVVCLHQHDPGRRYRTSQNEEDYLPEVCA
jgi:hypothetical protein